MGRLYAISAIVFFLVEVSEGKLSSSCSHPQGQEGESITEECLVRKCKKGVWRSSLATDLCCYQGRAYSPGTIVSTTMSPDHCVKASLECKEEMGEAKLLLSMKNFCAEYATQEQVEEIKGLIEKIVEKSCNMDGSVEDDKSLPGGSHIVNQFDDDQGQGVSDEEGQQFQHLVLDKNSGMIYVGAVNKIYHLTSNLELMNSIVTGPHLDSPFCSFLAHCPPSFPEDLTDNVNKVLLINYSDSQLISCGSLFQGSCTVRSLQNISNVEHHINEAVVANDAESTTVAFIAQGPPNTQVMYVGVTYTGNGPYRSEVPAVSSRSLDSEKLLQIAQTAETTGTRMYVNSLARERYPINYIHGFASEGFSYFLTTQMKETRPSPYHTKLVRVCQDDNDYYSYTEIPIQCISNDKNGKDYTLVQAAYVGKPGFLLAIDMGISTEDDVLFAVFSTPDTEEGDITSSPSNNSALCVYSLQSIRKQFLANIQKCFRGEGNRGVDFIAPSLNCVNTKLTQIGEEFCGLDVNTPFGGDLPITQTPALTFDTRITAVAATTTAMSTVAFLGTSNGHLKKIDVLSSQLGVEYADIPLAPGSSVRSDLVFDVNHDHVYAMTDKKISKVKVQNCEQYENCNQCVEADDPYCGWCKSENKCSSTKDCLESLHWIDYNHDSAYCDYIYQ